MGRFNREGPAAMDANVTMSDGTVRQLSEFWAHHRLVLVFLRHFG